jgi:hypothetical protein
MVMEELEYRDVMGDGRRCAPQPNGDCVPQPDPPADWRFVRRWVPWIIGGMLVVLIALILVSAIGRPWLH